MTAVMSDTSFPTTHFEYFMGQALSGLVVAFPSLPPEEITRRALLVAQEAERQYMQRASILKGERQ
jgi:hypothetical protein